MSAVRNRARTLRNRWVDQSLVQLQRAVTEIDRGAGELLLLGDSSFLSWAHSDTDRTLIPKLIADRTGASVVTIAAGGYDARIYDQLLRILGMLDRRPAAVVFSIAIRPNTSVHVREHPLHGHARSRAALERITPPLGRIRAFARGGTSVSEREERRFRELEVRTRWTGLATNGERLSKMEGLGPPPWPVEVEKARFDYFHGEFVDEDNPGLPTLTQLGRRLTEYGVPSVGHWAQPPMAHGERLFPGEFVDHVGRNLGLVESALARDAVGFEGLLKPVLDDEDYQDYRNGTEHYAYSGRLKISDEIAKTLAQLGL